MKRRWFLDNGYDRHAHYVNDNILTMMLSLLMSMFMTIPMMLRPGEKQVQLMEWP